MPSLFIKFSSFSPAIIIKEVNAGKNFIVKFLPLHLLVFFALLTQSVQAATITAAGDGNWSSTTPNAPWPGGVVPSTTDDVVISGGWVVTVTATAECASLTIGSNPGSLGDTLNVNAGITLTVNGNIHLIGGNAGTIQSTLNVGDGTVICNGITSVDGTTGARDCRVEISTGTLTVNGDVAMSTTVNRNLIVFSGAGLLQVSGLFETGTFTRSTGTVEYNGGNQDLNFGFRYYNLILSGTGTKSVTVTPTGSWSGTTTINAGITLDVADHQFTMTGLVMENTGGGAGATLTGTALSLITIGNGQITVNYSGSGSVSPGSIISAPLNISGNRTVSVADDGDANSADLTISAVISETGASRRLLKDGAGSMTLSGTNTFSNGLRINAGKTNIGSANAIGTGAFIVANGELNNTSGAPLTIINDITIAGDFTVTGTDNLTFTAASITYNVDAVVTVSAGTLTLEGTISSSTRSLTKAGGGTLSFATQDVSINNLTISAGTITATSGNLNINGDFTNNGTFNHNNGKVVFAGGAAQTIGGSSNTNFYHLEINNTNGLALNTAGVISNQLTLTDGIVTASALLTINSGATANEGSATSYVDGAIRKIGNQDFTFPTGNGAVWAPIAVTNFTVGDATTQFDAQYYDAQHASIAFTDLISPLKRVSFLEYWDLSHSGGTAPTVNVTLYWKDQSRSGTVINGSATSSDLVVAHWNGTKWESVGQSAVSIAAQGSVTSGAVSSFSPFTPGAIGGKFGDIPLPVELQDFEVISISEGNILNWSTSSEFNNCYFDLEKSTDGYNYALLAQIEGKINSNELSNYSFVDDLASSNTHNYYRLKQVDCNGDFEYSKVVQAKKLTDKQLFSFSPNPNSAGGILFLTLNEEEDFLVELIDMSGKLIHQESFFAEFFENEYQLLLPEIPPGVYLINVSSNAGRRSQKLTIQH